LKDLTICLLIFAFGCNPPGERDRAADAMAGFEHKLAITTALCKGDRVGTQSAVQAGLPLKAETVAEIATSAFYCGKEEMITLLPDGDKHRSNVLLAIACRGPKYVHRAKEAIQKGANVNQRDAAGETPFFSRLCRTDTALLKQAVAKGLDFGIENHKGQTIIQKAAAEADLDAVYALVLAGAPIPKNAVVLKRSERTVEDNRIETMYLPGNRPVTRKMKGERAIQYESKIPLLEYAKEHDPRLYRVLSSKMGKGTSPKNQ